MKAPRKIPAKKVAAKKAAAPSTPAKKLRATSAVDSRPHKPKVPGSTPGPATKRQRGGKVPQPAGKQPPPAAKGGSIPSAGSKKPKTRKSIVDTIVSAHAVQDPTFALAPKVKDFCDEYLRDLNTTAAYKRVHPDVTANSACVLGHRLLKKVHVQEYIAARRQRIELEIDYTRSDWIREMREIVRADPAELSQLRQVSCGECWPMENSADGKRPIQGIWTEPNPECLCCAGDGVPQPWYADTRRLSPLGRKLFTGVHKGKDGMRVLTHDQMAARVHLGKALGVFELDNAQKSLGAADALREMFAGLHGTRLPITRPSKPAAKTGNPLVKG